MIKKILLFTSALFISLAFGIANAAPNAVSAKHKIKLLYVLHAEKGKIIKTKTNQHQLMLNKLSKNIIYFSDRPDRIMGKITIQQFINHWAEGDDSFKIDNPNAALVGTLDTENPMTHGYQDSFIVLSNPSYNVNTKTLLFTIESINKTKLTTGNIKNISLFIDPNLCGPWCH